MQPSPLSRRAVLVCVIYDVTCIGSGWLPSRAGITGLFSSDRACHVERNTIGRSGTVASDRRRAQLDLTFMFALRRRSPRQFSAVSHCSSARLLLCRYSSAPPAAKKPFDVLFFGRDEFSQVVFQHVYNARRVSQHPPQPFRRISHIPRLMQMSGTRSS